MRYTRRPLIRTRNNSVARRMIPLIIIAILLALIWFVPLMKDNLLFRNEGSLEDDSLSKNDGSATLLENNSLSMDGERTDLASVDGEVVINSSLDGVNTYEEGYAIAGYDNELDVIANSDALSSVEGYGLSESGELIRPVSGFVFVNCELGEFPNLSIVGSPNSDALIKLKRVEDGETVLSFYVRQESTVKVCAPEGKYRLEYSLGQYWYGYREAFGDSGIYAACDKILDFSIPGSSYIYELGTDGGNVSPIPITREQFDENGKESSNGYSIDAEQEEARA